MEDQGKRLLLAVAIAFALLWGWNVLFPTEPPKEEDKAEEKTAEPAPEKPGPAEVPPTEPTVPEAPRGEEQIVRLEFPAFTAEFSSYGGALRSWVLTGEQFEDRRVSPAVPLDLIPTGARSSDYYAMQVSLGAESLEAMRRAEWSLVEKGSDFVTYKWTSDEVDLVKKYKIIPETFLLDLQIDVIPKGAAETKHVMTVSIFGYQDPEEDAGGGMTRLPREWKAACLIGDEVSHKSAKDLVKEQWRNNGEIGWGGLAHSYFIVGAALESRDGGLECDATSIDGYVGGMEVSLRFPPIVVSSDPYARRVVSYLGPKFVNSLEQASVKAGFPAGFEDSVDLGWLGFLSGPLLWLLTIFQSFVINWGLAIMALTIVIKLLLLPLTHKSIKSMKGMSKLKPQMDKLKEKYPDDKQKLQVETMALFKTNGVNPAAGCLPMILQMPIWFALYRMLMAAAELYQAPFIPGWIDDLTAPDPLYILPVTVMILMFFQTKLTPTTASGLQGKVLMYGMPIMFGFFSLFFPAGLTLYIFTNTSLTLIHYYFVHKEDRDAAKIAKAKKKARVEAGEDEDEDEEEDEDDEERETSDSSEDEDEPKAAKGSAKSGSNGKSNGNSKQKQARKTGKGSRGGKKSSKKKKRKKGSSGI